MASLAAGIVDPTKAGKYRVVLSDALLGKDPKEVYTGIRYNHKPSLSSSTAPFQARMKPASSSGDASCYDLAFQDNGGRYVYNGTRGHEDGQYVLIFDPEREVFVLHRVDSIFNMNLVRTPTNHDAESLRNHYPQLEAHRSLKSRKTATNAGAGKSAKPKKPAAKVSTPKKAEPPKPPQPPKPKVLQHDSEDESSDDDLLTIEDPGGAAPNPHRDFSPGFIDKPRRFSEFVQQQNDEEEDEEDDVLQEVEVEVLNDADGEEEEGDAGEAGEEEEDDDDDDDDDDESEHFKLPSPITRQMMGQNINSGGGNSNVSVAAYNNNNNYNVGEEISDEDEDMEDVGQGGAGLVQADAAVDDNDVDLEAALMAEMAELSQPEPDVESDVSEEE